MYVKICKNSIYHPKTHVEIILNLCFALCDFEKDFINRNTQKNKISGKDFNPLL